MYVCVYLYSIHAQFIRFRTVFWYALLNRDWFFLFNFLCFFFFLFRLRKLLAVRTIYWTRMNMLRHEIYFISVAIFGFSTSACEWGNWSNSQHIVHVQVHVTQMCFVSFALSVSVEKNSETTIPRSYVNPLKI